MMHSEISNITPRYQDKLPFIFIFIFIIQIRNPAVVSSAESVARDPAILICH
jgi:hypothetical protein